eukprot:SAG11_NODE_1209_length_5520_cov_6.530529_3_plen_76_part_00
MAFDREVPAELCDCLCGGCLYVDLMCKPSGAADPYCMAYIFIIKQYSCTRTCTAASLLIISISLSTFRTRIPVNT